MPADIIEPCSSAIYESYPINADLCRLEICGYLSDKVDGLSSEDLTKEVDRLTELCNSSYSAIHDAVCDIQAAKKDWFEYTDGELANRGARRNPKRTLEVQYDNIRRTERANVESMIGEFLRCDWDAYPATEANVYKLENFKTIVSVQLLKKRLGPSVDDTLDRDRLHTAYTTALLSELQARTDLAMFCIDNPSLAGSLFKPSNIDELPDSMKRIVSADILRGRDHSVILQHAVLHSEYHAANEAKGHQISECIDNSGLTEKSRSLFNGAMMGAVACGAPVCPYNKFGLCEKVIEKVIEKLDLPHDVASEVDRKLQSIENDRVAQLVRFASNVGKDPLMLNCKSLPAEAICEEIPEPMKKRRTPLLALFGIKKPEEEPVVAKELPFNRVIAKVKGHEELQIDPADEGCISKVVQEIVDTDMFREYITEHNTNGRFRTFLEHAVRTILFYPGEQSISKIYGREFYFEGKKVDPYHLTGERLKGVGGGKIGRATRIFFIHLGEGKDRRVIFTGVKHKRELIKNIPMSVITVAS